jgi:hypothetical protein
MSDTTDDEVPAYWFSPGHAPNFSRNVALAHLAVKRAQDELTAELKRAYPHGCRVQVIHSRGSFFGHVSGWDYSGCRVAVTNEQSGKWAWWWSAHVQRCK